MSDPSHIEVDAPPAGEHIHMPSSSILPLLNAVGLALVIVNITGALPLLIAGAVLFVVTAAIWIRSAARETAELPLDHHH
jgi:Flp pilus assembly protein TadB